MYSGIIPALLTPFTPDEQLDTRALCGLIEFLLANGADGLYVCGSSGEGLLMTEEERRLVIETTTRQVAKRVPVIVHVGAPATAMSERLARHASQAGADAVSSIPPFYYPTTQQGIELHYRRIATAAGLPVYVYHAPHAAQVSLGAPLILHMYTTSVIHGLKYTAYDPLTFRAIVEACGPEFNMLSGPDEMLLQFLTLGAHGGIGLTYNCMPSLYKRLFDAWKQADLQEAQQLQFQVNRVVLALLPFGGIAATKAAMRFIGVDCGVPRAPLTSLSKEQQETLRAELEQAGFFRQ